MSRVFMGLMLKWEGKHEYLVLWLDVFGMELCWGLREEEGEWIAGWERYVGR